MKYYVSYQFNQGGFNGSGSCYTDFTPTISEEAISRLEKELMKDLKANFIMFVNFTPLEVEKPTSSVIVSHLDTDGKVRISKAFRDKLGIDYNDRLEMYVDGDKIVMKKCPCKTCLCFADETEHKILIKFVDKNDMFNIVSYWVTLPGENVDASKTAEMILEFANTCTQDAETSLEKRASGILEVLGYKFEKKNGIAFRPFKTIVI